MDSKNTFEEILARRRQGSGSPVSLDEILTLHDAAEGEASLTAEEREDLLERISIDPAAAYKLRALLQFSEQPPTAEDSGADAEARWQTFRDRMAADPNPVLTPAPVVAQLSPSFRFTLLPLAASFLIGALAMWTLGSWRTPLAGEVLANLPIIELVNDQAGQTLRSGAPRSLPATAEGIVVTLTPQRVDNTGKFELTVISPSGQPALQRTELRPIDGGIFVVTLPRSLLANGKHQLRLSQEGQLVDSFELEIALSP